LVKRERIHTTHAPAAIGAYSQGIRIGDLVYSAGQLGLDPGTGVLIEGGIAEQTRRVLENLGAVLDAGGSSLDDVIKTTVFITDMANFGAMNEVYKQYFSGDTPPARSTVQVAGLPLGAMVEIECVAALKGDG
jgi:2-iminobutanoate/2-iminopropanoate deaminase